MCVSSARGGAQSCSRSNLQLLVLRERLLPLLPDAVLAHRHLAVVLETPAALAVDGTFPLRPELRGFSRGFPPDEDAQDVEIVHLSENVLQQLQVAAPGFILL